MINIQYEVEIRVQDSGQNSGQNEEVIQDMKNVVKILLKKALVMFRDGVSEGQFTTVMARELIAVWAACKELQESYEPQITYIVVQNRHHTRLFPMELNKNINGNSLAGTVVDLLSNKGIQGTSRLCHYHVVWDDIKLTHDQLEVLACYISPLYTWCTR